MTNIYLSLISLIVDSAAVDIADIAKDAEKNCMSKKYQTSPQVLRHIYVIILKLN